MVPGRSRQRLHHALYHDRPGTHAAPWGGCGNRAGCQITHSTGWLDQTHLRPDFQQRAEPPHIDDRTVSVWPDVLSGRQTGCAGAQNSV